MSTCKTNESKTKPRKSYAITFTQPSKTQQQYAESTDINFMVKRYIQTGEFPLATRPPVYADVSQIPDFNALQDKIIKAEEAFFSLPAELRNQFDNDPAKLLEWASLPHNQKSAQDIGLVASPSEDLTKASKNDKISAVDSVQKP